MALQDGLYGLTPPGSDASDELEAIIKRLQSASADAGKSQTVPFAGAIMQDGEFGRSLPPEERAPATTPWRTSMEAPQRLESQDDQRFHVPQTAPIVRPVGNRDTAPPSAANPREVGNGNATGPGAVPKAGGMTPYQVPQSKPSFADHLINIGNGFTGRGATDLDQQAETQNQTAQALIKLGVAPELVTAATRNPEIMKALVTSAFTKQLQPVEWKMEDIYDEKSGRKRRVMINPRNPSQMIPVGGEAMGRDQGLNPTEQKTLNAAEDGNVQLEGTIEGLNRALELNPKIFEGLTSGLRGKIGTAAGRNTMIGKAIDDGLGIDRNTA